MENRSNVIFDVNGRKRPYFDATLCLAVGLESRDTVKAFYVDEEKNRIVLLWYNHEKSNALMAPLTADEISDQVWAWLETRTPTEKPMNHDGDSVKGWRMYVDNMWGHVEPFNSYAIVAIEPVWIEYGK